jgi:deoxyribonuclease-2
MTIGALRADRGGDMLGPLDESGKPVDWWFVYKVPMLGGTDDASSTTGFEYAYYDATMDRANGNVVSSPNRIGDGNGALDRTLKAAFGKPAATMGYVLYNDEMPPSTKLNDNANLGHTKGVLAFDTKTKRGFWLLHSWPKFADPRSDTDPAPMYGQTYLCLSLDLASLEKIAAQMLQFQEPQTYFCRRGGLGDGTSSLAKLMTQPVYDVKPGTNVLDLKTVGGLKFRVIAKNREWNGDFWNDLVGPTLKEDLDVETWIRSVIPPQMDKDGIHKTFDIKYVNLGPLGIHYAWPETRDHAKWAISLKSDWVCIGDINRMISQRKRGGGAIAFQNRTLWTALTKTALLLAPPGHTREMARHVLQRTHR